MCDTESPGMLALANAVSLQTWPHTIDARVWAEKWMKAIKDHPEIANDQAAMVGWFANAILAGYDTATMRMGKNE